MKFSKEYPTIPGYYWYVDVDNPVPMIGYVYNNILSVLHGKSLNLLEKVVSEHIRIGDQIAKPQTKDNEIEQ